MGRIFYFIAIFELLFGLSFARNGSRPIFPETFQTEIEGIFFDHLEEVSGSLFYDYKKNRGALFYTYQKESTRTIYDFANNKLLYIMGPTCDVYDIDNDPTDSFFPFTTDGNKKKHIATAEKVLFFSNSEFEREEISIFPTFVYTGIMDIPKYKKENCTIMHVFTRPEIVRPDCDKLSVCAPTLMAINVKCKDEVGDEDVNHSYNFYRFQETIEDESVFQPPAGVNCRLNSTRKFPVFPDYFSFTYDITTSDGDALEDSSVYTSHKKVWYDRGHKIIRIDEYDDDGLQTSSRIYDLPKRMAYAIIAALSTCQMGPIEGTLDLDAITNLPKIFFSVNPVTLDKAVYVGKRKERGLNYDVWSLTWTDEESDAKMVLEIYFLKTAPIYGIAIGELTEDDFFLQVSHTQTYAYEPKGQDYELSMLKILEINNFRSKPKEWAAYDIASCFTNKQKKAFKLLVKGPPLVKESHMYHNILEQLYDKITSVTKVSILRINELTGVFDGVHLSEVKGWILTNSSSEQDENGSALDLEEIYKKIEESAADGLLSVTVTKDKKDMFYNITSVEIVSENKTTSSLLYNLYAIYQLYYIFSSAISSDEICYSEVSMAVACTVPLVAGLAIGSIGIYIFIKRRKPRSDNVLLESLN